jgi:hypothetical protein
LSVYLASIGKQQNSSVNTLVGEIIPQIPFANSQNTALLTDNLQPVGTKEYAVSLIST